MEHRSQPDQAFLESLAVDLLLNSDFDIEKEIVARPELEVPIRQLAKQAAEIRGDFHPPTCPVIFDEKDYGEELRRRFSLLPVQLEIDFDEMSWDSAELPSRSLGNRYRFLAHYKAGGMSRIYVGYDTALCRLVALKVPSIEDLTAGDPSSRSGFLQRVYAEGCITAQLEHSNIGPIYDVGVIDGGPLVVVLKLVRGRPLRDLIQDLNQGDMERSHRELAGLVLSVCEALAYAHTRQVIHRDLKPSNILVGAHNEVQVLDWGLALVLDGPTNPPAVLEQHGESPQAGTFVGSPTHMAPELATGIPSQHGPWTDVFGVGSVLYNLCTGVTPYSGDTDLDLVAKAGSRELPDRSSWIRKPAPELLGIAMRAMAKAPTERYASVEELSEDIHRFLDQRPSPNWKLPLHRRVSNGVSRHPALTVATFSALAIALLASLLMGSLESNSILRHSRRVAEMPRVLQQIDQNEARGVSILAETAQHKAIVRGDRSDDLSARAQFLTTSNTLLDFLTEWGVDLLDVEGLGESMKTLRAHPEEIRSPLELALYRFIEHQHLNGIAYAVMDSRSPLPPGSPFDGETLRRKHPVLTKAFGNVRSALELYGSQDIGLQALDLLEGLAYQGKVTANISDVDLTAAGPGELQLFTFWATNALPGDAVFPLLDRAVELAPSNFWLRMRQLTVRVKLAYRSGDPLSEQSQDSLKLAAAHGEAAAALWPGSYSVPSNLALAYEFMGLIDRAKQILIEKAKADPSDHAVRMNLAAMHIDSEEFAEAASWAEQAVQIAPQDWSNHTSLGIALVGLVKQTEPNSKESLKAASRAVEALGTAFDLNPSSTHAAFHLARALRLSGDVDQAIQQLEKAIDLGADEEWIVEERLAIEALGESP